MTDRSNPLRHVHRGFGSVRPYLHGPLPGFLERTFGAVVLESNPDGRDDPTNHFKTEGFFRSSIWNSRAVWPFPG